MATEQEPQPHARRRRPQRRSGASRRKSNIFLVLVGIALAFEVLGWYFVGQSFLINKQRLTMIILQVSVIGIIAVGVTQVIITGGIDLSSGSVVGITAMVAASLAQNSSLARAVYPALTDSAGVLSGHGGFARRSHCRAHQRQLDRLHDHSAVHRHARHDGDRARHLPNCTPAASRSHAAGRFHCSAISFPSAAFRAACRVIFPGGGADLPHRAALHALWQIHLCDWRQCPGGARLRHQCRPPPVVVYGIAGLLSGLAGVVTSARAISGQAGMGVIMSSTRSPRRSSAARRWRRHRPHHRHGDWHGDPGRDDLGIHLPALDAYYQEIVKGMIIVAAVIVDQYRQRRRKKA